MWAQCQDLIDDFLQVPTYHLVLEGVLFLWIVWLLARRYQKRGRGNEIKLTKEEEEELLAEWKPEPLVPEEIDVDIQMPIVDGKAGGKVIIIEGIKCLNFGTHNYLGFAGREDIEEEAVKCIQKFGVGSCGPRAFYGTADIHVKLEEKLAQFFGCEQACLYSYGFSTIASAIPAYAKKGDIVFVDEAVNFAIQKFTVMQLNIAYPPFKKALDASRGRIKYFKHNDVDHLEHLLDQYAKEELRHPKLAKMTRKFLVIEGIYMNTGQVCKLKKMISLKTKHKLRLFIDESVSFGVLGSSGRGIAEHFDIDVDDIDLIMATLENAMGSIGGFCVGSSYVVEHQTLAGLGYCFSASLPPMFAAGALKSIEILENNPDLPNQLARKSELLHDHFDLLPGLELHGDRISPVKHLRVANPDNDLSRQDQKKILRNIVQRARQRQLALTMAAYLEDVEVCCPLPSIRLTVSVLMEDDLIIKAGQIIQDVIVDSQQ